MNTKILRFVGISVLALANGSQSLAEGRGTKRTAAAAESTAQREKLMYSDLPDEIEALRMRLEGFKTASREGGATESVNPATIAAAESPAQRGAVTYSDLPDDLQALVMMDAGLEGASRMAQTCRAQAAIFKTDPAVLAWKASKAREAIREYVGNLIEVPAGKFLFTSDNVQVVLEENLLAGQRYLSQGQYRAIMGQEAYDVILERLREEPKYDRYGTANFIGDHLPISMLTAHEEDVLNERMTQMIAPLWAIAYPETNAPVFMRPTAAQYLALGTKMDGTQLKYPTETGKLDDIPRREFKEGPRPVNDPLQGKSVRGFDGLAKGIWVRTATLYPPRNLNSRDDEDGKNLDSEFCLMGAAWYSPKYFARSGFRVTKLRDRSSHTVGFRPFAVIPNL